MPPYPILRGRTQQPRMQTPDVRVALSHFLRQIETAHVRTRTQQPKPLHYDSLFGALGEYAWPCELNPLTKSPYDAIRRIAPCDLEAHRRTHRFRAPSCLCAFIDGLEYTESQIAVVEVLAKDGDRNSCLLNGEIVAQCAKQRCGYLLCLERFYTLSDLRVHQYPARATPLPAQDLVHISDIEKSFRRGDGLFQVMPDVVLRGNRRALEQVVPNDAKAIQSRLCGSLMAGIPEADFWTTFVQCMQCQKVTFRQHYAVNHRCSPPHSIGKAAPTRLSSRQHPYRREAIANVRPTGRRALVRTETLLIGDQPEDRPMHSMSRQRRALTPESAYNYDPEDITIPEDDASDCSTDCGSEFETAQEEASDLDLDDDGPSGTREGSTEPWWIHDAPELPSDDSLPDMLTVLERTRWSSTSNIRTQLNPDQEAPDAAPARLEPEEQGDDLN